LSWQGTIENIAGIKLAATLILAFAAGLSTPSAASARPCSDRVAVFVDGKQWIVYTGDSARERREVPCRKARRIARKYIATRTEMGRWDCRHTLRVKRCVKGGTYVDEYGFEQPRYLVGWHAAD
jgi:hypothetical protein